MQSFHTVIIGAGFGGLCMGIQMKLAGRNDFVILEKAQDLGGTWRENTYPGAECDIPSALYSYSFEHNAEWEFVWSGQKQIHQYQRDTAEKYGLPAHIRYGQKLVSAVFNEDRQRWQLSTDTGEEFECQHFVCAVGQLHHPSTPNINGAELFSGAQFHSAQWNHEIDLTGKRVGVIGNAASAVQFIPEIAKQVAHLEVYQRSANWILPKVDRQYSKWEQRLSEKMPVITKVYRWFLWALGEYGVLNAIRGRWPFRWLIRKYSESNLKKEIQDSELRKKLTPNYPLGAKRVLFTDHYYAALARENVTLNTQGITQIEEQGIRDQSGETVDLDVIIYGTGFKTNPFLSDIHVVGRQGKSIREHWSEGAHAYLGISTSGFPNLHLLYGPNTNLGHTSIIIMLEAQVAYILQAMDSLEQKGKLSMEVLPGVEESYNQALQARLKKLAFNEVAHSWYMDGNRITNNWAGGTREYRKRLKSVDWSDYVVT